MPVVKLNLIRTVASLAEATPLLRAPGDAALVLRGRPRLLVLECACGCGERFPINLDDRAGPAWRMYSQTDRGLSVFPSIWRDTGCQSHYISGAEISIFSAANNSIGKAEKTSNLWREPY